MVLGIAFAQENSKLMQHNFLFELFLMLFDNIIKLLPFFFNCQSEKLFCHKTYDSLKD